MTDQNTRLMEHVCSAIDQVGYVIDPTMRVTAWGVDVARQHFGEAKEQLALFILRLVEVYAERTEQFTKPSNFDVAYAFTYGKKICDDIALFGKGNKLLLASCNYSYGMAAKRFGLKELAAEFFETALVQPSMQPLPEQILKELESLYKEEEATTGACLKLAVVLEQLLDVDQLNPEEDNARRFRLVEHYKATGRYKKIREVLLPLCLRLDTYDYTMFQVICHGMADSFTLEGKHDAAGPWVVRALEMRPDHHRN